MTSATAKAHSDKPNSWLVRVNSVSVGRIQNDDYEKICASVRKDRGLLLRQLLNVAGTGFRLGVVAMFLPWTLIGAGLTLIAWYLQVSPEIRFESLLALIIPVSMVAIVGLLGTIALFPRALRALGFRNLYRDAVDDQVREWVRCPALGSVYLLDDRAFTAQAAPAAEENPQP